MTGSASMSARRPTARAELPEDRPLVYFLTLTDGRGATVSTEHKVLPKE